MDVLKNVLVLLHFLGFAALAGGAMTQLGQARPTLNRFIKDGAWTQLLTGLALVVFAEFGPLPVNHAKIGLKLIVLVAIIVLVLVNRRPERARLLADRHADIARQSGVVLQVADIDDPGRAFDVVINATASSLQAAAVPVPRQVLREGTLALDMMYGSAAQGFLDWAHQGGSIGRDGLGMLVEQAAEAFHAWRGVRPDSAPVLQALRKRLSPAA